MLAVAAVEAHDRRLVPELRRVVGWAAERLAPIGREALMVLRVVAVLEGMAHDLARQHATVPCLGHAEHPIAAAGSLVHGRGLRHVPHLSFPPHTVGVLYARRRVNA